VAGGSARQHAKSVALAHWRPSTCIHGVSLHERSASRSLNEELELNELLYMDVPGEVYVNLEIDHTLDSVLHVSLNGLMVSRCHSVLVFVLAYISDYGKGRMRSQTATVVRLLRLHRLVSDWHNTDLKARRRGSRAKRRYTRRREGTNGRHFEV
jgi:hypothetical protein